MLGWNSKGSTTYHQNNPIWTPCSPNPGGRVWGITLVRSVLLGCHQSLNSADFLSSDLQHDWFNTTAIFKISMFYHIIICFLLLVTKAGWLKWHSSPINTDGSIRDTSGLPGWSAAPSSYGLSLTPRASYLLPFADSPQPFSDALNSIWRDGCSLTSGCPFTNQPHHSGLIASYPTLLRIWCFRFWRPQ